MDLQVAVVPDAGAVQVAAGVVRSDAERGLFLVCDGVDGLEGGALAARRTADLVTAALVDGPASVPPAERDGALVASTLRNALERASAELHEGAQDGSAPRGAACSCTVLVLAGKRAVLAHVGDSRCYLMRGPNLSQVTDDHTYVAEALKMGLLTPDEAESSPYTDVLTRAVGIQAGVLVDLVTFDLAPGDTLLVSAAGLHDRLRDPEQLRELLGDLRVEDAARALLGLARDGGDEGAALGIVVRVPTSQVGNASALRGLETLRHIELLGDLDMTEVFRLFAAFEAFEADPGENLVTEGELSDGLYVLVAGTVEVVRRGRVVATLARGSHFGEISLLAGLPRTATIRTLERCHLLVARRESLYPVVLQDPLLGAKLFWRLAHTMSLRLDEAYTAEPAPAVKAAAVRPGWRETRIYAMPVVLPPDEE